MFPFFLQDQQFIRPGLENRHTHKETCKDYEVLNISLYDSSVNLVLITSKFTVLQLMISKILSFIYMAMSSYPKEKLHFDHLWDWMSMPLLWMSHLSEDSYYFTITCRGIQCTDNFVKKFNICKLRDWKFWGLSDKGLWEIHGRPAAILHPKKPIRPFEMIEEHQQISLHICLYYHERPRQNFSLHYQCKITQTSDENKGKC